MHDGDRPTRPGPRYEQSHQLLLRTQIQVQLSNMEDPTQFDLIEYINNDQAGEAQSLQFFANIDTFIENELGLKLACDDPSSSPHSEASTASDIGSNLVTTTCPVCGGEIKKGHVYYGAVVCISCRGFFQRAVHSHHFKAFKCLDGLKECQVTVTTRRRCKFCRFQKCIRSGMRVSWVLKEAQRRQKTTNKAIASSVQATRPTQFEVDLYFSDDEVKLYESQFLKIMQVGNDKYLKYFATDKKLFHEFVSFMTSKDIVTLSLFKKLEAMDTHVMKSFAFYLPDMDKLCISDKVTLIQRNLGTILGLLCCSFSHPKDLSWHMEQFLLLADQKRSSDAGIDQLMAQLEINGINDSVKLSDGYANRYIPVINQVCGEDRIAEVTNLMAKINDPLRPSPTTDMDKVVVLLLILIIIFQTGTFYLEEPSTVEALHQHYAYQLFRYFKTKFGASAAKRLHQAFMAIVYSQRLYQLTSIEQNEI